MKVLFTYRSITGNTRKIVQAMYDEIQADKEIKTFEETESLEGYDLTFVGFPIEGYGPGYAAENFLAQHVKGKRIVLVITHASDEESALLQDWLDLCRDAAEGAEIVGLFHCKGELSKQVADVMLKSADPHLVVWAKMRDDTLGQPDASRIEKARMFAKKIMEKEA